MERAKETLLRLLFSAKVWAAVSGGIIAILARRGIVLDPEDVTAVRDITLALVGALGLQDLGKAVASKGAPIAAGGDVVIEAAQPAKES